MYSCCQEKFISDQSFVHGKVKAALQNYEQNVGHSYELRVICGVNESVGSRRSFRDFKRPYSHVNFWASPNVSDSAGTNLLLFFAEFCNDGEDKEDQQSICCPVLDLSTNVRCCYCELEGIKIVQPACGSYHGSYCEFEKMALGEHTITNERIISHGKLTASSVGMFGEDYIYFDPARDAKFVQAMNQTAWAENVSWDEFEKLEQLDVY